MLEDWIDEDNPVRVIDVFVDGLDLADLGFIGVYITPTVAGKGHPLLPDSADVALAKLSGS